MPRWTNMVLAITAALFALILVSGCSGIEHNGAVNRTTVPLSEPALAWPPPVSTARHASDYQTRLDGSQWTSKGGASSDDGTSLQLAGGDALPWAVYSVAQLGADNELTGVDVIFSLEPGTPGDGTSLFVALANYDVGAWEWYMAAAPPLNQQVLGGARYRSPVGDGHIAVVLAGPGQASIERVTFIHTGDSNAPQNLTGGVLDVGLVHLSWDNVAEAEGYNVYRTRKSDLSQPKKLNDGLVAASEFTDDDLNSGHYYWYWVKAVVGEESSRSNVVRLWAFEVDLPAPTNLRVIDRDIDSFRVAWDWDSPDNPSGGWQIFLSTVPDFLITDAGVEVVNYTYGGGRQAPISGRASGVLYYWKMCARDEHYDRGRISEECTGSGTGSWTWANVETIAEGQVPLSAARVEQEMAVAYFNGDSIDVAIRDQGTWSSDTALLGNGSRFFGEYLDLDYYGGMYIVAGYDLPPGDAYASYGGPGDWSQSRVNGDGGTGFPHDVSGLYARAAVCETELILLHYDLSASVLRLHTRTIGEFSWPRTELRSLGENAMPDHDLAFLGDNLFVLSADVQTDELRLGDRDGGWRFDLVLGEGAPELTQYLNLARCQDQWYATAFDRAGQNLYILSGTSLPWTHELIAEGGGHGARIAAEDEEAVVIFRADNQLQFASLSSGWKYEPVKVPGSSNINAVYDILLIDGLAHVFFRDKDDGMIKVVRGTPPPE